jgi:glycosyltransferase involved in cell wall biosynthesis
MMRSPRVTTVITTFNHERYIADAIASVLAQEVTFEHQIVIGDDCSTDGTREIVMGFHRRHQDAIRLVLPARNLGHRGNVLFREILKIVGGEYVAMLDGDDYWISSTKLQQQVEFLDAHPACSMCFHDAFIELPDGTRASNRCTPDWVGSTVTCDELWRDCTIASCAPLMRKAILEDLPAWYQECVFGDWPLYFLAALQGPIGYLPTPMAVHRAHGRGMWSGATEEQQIRDVIVFFRQMRRRVPRRYRGGCRTSIARHRLKLAKALARNGSQRRAVVALMRAIAFDPLATAARRGEVRAILHALRGGHRVS